MTDSFPKSQKGWHVVNPTTLGDRFAATLKEWLTPEEFAEMKRRNETDPTYANLSCASHDFCDANMAMDSAWRDLIGTEINADDEEQAALWNAAWEIARRRHIGHQ
jgi:hypothetical protein